MAWFTSAYKALVHGAPNWDTQLRTDMQTLETNMDQGGWTPGYGGDTGATAGSGALYTGAYARLGSRMDYAGRITFGSSAVAGGGVITNVNIGTNNTALSWGDGHFRNANTGARARLTLVALSASEFKIQVVRDGYHVDFSQLIASPPQQSELFVHLRCWT